MEQYIHDGVNAPKPNQYFFYGNEYWIGIIRKVDGGFVTMTFISLEDVNRAETIKEATKKFISEPGWGLRTQRPGTQRMSQNASILLECIKAASTPEEIYLLHKLMTM